MIYERYLEENLFMLQDGLLEGSYIHSDYTPFIVRDPKERQIHKATVKDRVMHQAIFNIIEPIFERRFIFDSYSCRIGKGTHSASYRLNSFLRRSSRNDNRTVYVLKCDIKKFFDCIDHEILLRLLRRDIEDKSTIVLLKHILDSFEKSPAKGLPLGNLTSQLFVNIYLHELDYFVKHKLREKYYLRYCDDFVIVRPSRKHLLNIISIIQEFLIEQLKLDIHPDKISIRTWRQGIDFVGYVHMPHCIVLRNKTKKRMLRRIDAHNISSYLGLCKHADTFELQQLLLTKVADQNFIERY